MSFSLSGVSYTYPRGRRPVLSGLDLEVPGGATTALLGPSGAGKSTLLYLLGLLWEGRLGAGTITYRHGGHDYRYDRLRPAQRSRLRREQFGFALQSSYLLPHLTCAQNIAMPLALAGQRPGSWDAAVDRLIRRADSELAQHLGAGAGAERDAVPDDDRGLADVRDKVAAEISGGQRQRIALLRALVHDPQVVFADEPFSSLDAVHAELILDLLRDWQLGRLDPSSPVGNGDGEAAPRTLILVCHDLEFAYRYADYFVVLDRGGGVVGGRPLARAELPGGPGDLFARIDPGARV